MVVRNSFFLVGTVGLPPGLYIAGDEIVGRGGRMGGSSILYSSRGWGNSFPSRGGEQTCPPPQLSGLLSGIGGWGNSFSLWGWRTLVRPPPSLYVAGDEIVGGGGPWG